MKHLFLFCLLIGLASCEKEINYPEFQGRPEGPLVSTVVVNDQVNKYYYDTQRRLVEFAEMNRGRTFLQYTPGEVNISSYEYAWLFTLTEGSILLGDNGLLLSAEYSGAADNRYANIIQHTEVNNTFSVNYNGNNHLESASQIKDYDIYSPSRSEQRRFEDTETLKWDNGNLIKYKYKRIARFGFNGAEVDHLEYSETSVFTYTNLPNLTYICFNINAFDRGEPIRGLVRYAELGLLGNLCPYLPEHVVITTHVSETYSPIVHYTYSYTFTDDGLLESATRQADDPEANYAEDPITWKFTYNK